MCEDNFEWWVGLVYIWNDLVDSESFVMVIFCIKVVYKSW